jgi:hypothetical protein
MFLGFFSLSFLLTVFLSALFLPQATAIFLIVYGFLWILKISVHVLHTIYTYKRLRRWDSFDWQQWMQASVRSEAESFALLKEFGHKYRKAIDWDKDINKGITNIANSQLKPHEVLHIPVFPVYEENLETLKTSLERVYGGGYPLDKMLVIISQEDRVSTKFNNQIIKGIEKLAWTNVSSLCETDLDIIYNNSFPILKYSNKNFKNFRLQKDKLNILITRHPDGLVGEIKGKASNEDWGARQAALYCKSHQIDPAKVVVTSLDADSRPDYNFFLKLSYQFIAAEDREYTGFHHMPVYSNNFFESDTIPRMIATQTTLWNLVQASLVQELTFFSTYSLTLSMLERVDFWMRDVIAEDIMLFAKCLDKTQGKFSVKPAYGIFEGDVVEAEDFLQAIVNQYKQLQRWAWGGVEVVPYLFYIFFLNTNGKLIPIKSRMRYLGTQFLNHFFWATPPFVFSVGVVLPGAFAGEEFYKTNAAQTLSIFSEYYAWTSYIFLLVFAFITFRFIAPRAIKTPHKKMTVLDIISVVLQFLISPLVYGFMGFPAIDAQVRGLFGKYLGYWVTPKK